MAFTYVGEQSLKEMSTLLLQNSKKTKKLLEAEIDKKASQTELDTERKRIDNLSKLPEGSTAGDAELVDIRVGADGNTYGTAGESVRKQFLGVHDSVDVLNKSLVDYSTNINRSSLFKDDIKQKSILTMNDYWVNTVNGTSRGVKLDKSICILDGVPNNLQIASKIQLEAGKTYTVFALSDQTESTFSMYLHSKVTNSNLIGFSTTKKGVLKRFTPSDTDNNCYLYIYGSAPVNCVVSVFILEGVYEKEDFYEFEEVNKKIESNINNIDIINNEIFGDNLVNTETSTVDFAVRYENGAAYDFAGASVSDRIEVEPDCYYEVLTKFYISEDSPYGHVWQDADKHYLDGIKPAQSDITKPFIVKAPANAKYLRISYNTKDSGDIFVKKIGTIRLNEVSDAIKEVRNRVDAVSVTSFNNDFKKVLKDYYGYIDDYGYLSFSSGVYWHGKEIYAMRLAKGHMSPESVSDYGKIVFFIRDEGNKWDMTYPNLPYSEMTGEMRDPNITLSPDGETLFLSVFTTNNSDASNPSLHSSALFSLNTAYETTSWCYVTQDTNKCVWGNTLITPNGYILKTTYNRRSPYAVELYKSTTAYNGTLDGMTFAYACELFDKDGFPNETNIGYFNDKLVAVCRNEYKTTSIKYTTDLEGETGWSNEVSMEIELHSPYLSPYCGKNKLFFAGSNYHDMENRYPMIGYLDIVSGKVITSYEIVKNSRLGGYPSVVFLSDDIIGTCYYMNGNTTRNEYQQINLRKVLNLSYIG